VYELNNSYAATHEAACSVDYYSDYPGLKLICSTNHLLHSLSGSFRTVSYGTALKPDSLSALFSF